MRKLNALLLGVALIGASAARGEIFLLQNEGRVRGQILNPDQSPRENYVIKTPAGGQIILEADQVKQVMPQSAAEMEYDRVRLRYPDTAQGQWELAEWCREKKLPKQRTTHLERVIALDGNHVQGRRALGYISQGGKWLTRDESMESKGYIRYKNEWVLPQEAQLREERRKEDASQGEWRRNLNRWRQLLDTDKSDAARASILAIQDPYAVKALAQNLANEPSQGVRLLYIEALGKIGTFPAMDVLATRSVADHDEEIRLSCLDKLAAAHYQPAVASFIQMLKSKDNVIVNRAGVALAHMKDARAVASLIDALVTTHTFKVVKGQPGQMSNTFGAGPGGTPGTFSFGGGGATLVKEQLSNRDVLDALVALTGGANFNYDVKAWKAWYALQKKRTTLDARRD